MTPKTTRCPLPVFRIGAMLACAATWQAPAQAQLLDLNAVVKDLLELDARVTVNTGDIAVVNARVDTNFRAVDRLTLDVARLFDGLDAQSRTLAAVQSAATTSAAATAALTGRVDAQVGVLDAIGARVAANADAAASAVARIDADAQVQGRLVADINNRSLTNSVRIGDITTNINNIDARVTVGVQRIDALDARVTVANQRIDMVDARVTTTNQRIDVVAGDLAALDQRVTGHDRAIAGVTQTANAARDDAADLRRQVVAGTIGLVQQSMPDAPVTVAAATGGTVVSIAGAAGDRRLSGLAGGTAANDAATLGQVQAGDRATLLAATGYTDDRVAALNAAMESRFGAALADSNRVLRRDMNATAAGGAALAGLPQSIVPGKGMMGAAIGGRGEEVAFALGLSKAFDSESAPVLKAGAAIDARRGTVSYNAAVGIHF